jgi:hypothetical protein
LQMCNEDDDLDEDFCGLAKASAAIGVRPCHRGSTHSRSLLQHCRRS